MNDGKVLIQAFIYRQFWNFRNVIVLMFAQRSIMHTEICKWQTLSSVVMTIVYILPSRTHSCRSVNSTKNSFISDILCKTCVYFECIY